MASKTMLIKATEAQLKALMSLVDDCDTMIGAGDPECDRIWAKHIRSIDRMLANNGLKRRYYVKDRK